MSKPGRGTVETLSAAILAFETSPSAMRRDQHLLSLAEHLDRGWRTRGDDGKAVAIARLSHRELRRVARRLAKKAKIHVERQRAELAEARSLHVLYIKRIQRLEDEIDCLVAGKPGGYVELERRALQAEARLEALKITVRAKLGIEESTTGMDSIPRLTLDEAAATDAAMQEREAIAGWIAIDVDASWNPRALADQIRAGEHRGIRPA